MAGNTTRSFGDLLNPVTMPLRHQLGLLGLFGLGVVPFVVRDISTLKITGALFFAVYVMTWDVVSGYTGEISFGHALFFGVGAYTSGILNVHAGVPILASIPLGVLAAALAGLIIGFPSLRVHGPYFSLITLVAPIILISVFRYYPDLTGGEVGMFGIETLTPMLTGRLTILGGPTVSWSAVVANYYVAFTLFLATLAVFLAVTRSDAGTVLTAIREDEMAVQAGGLNPAKYKLFAFVLSGTVGGLAGALFVHTYAQGVANPSDLLALVLSIELIVAAILGGMGTIVGAAVGGLFFWLLRDSLRNISELVIPLPPFGRLTVELTIPIVNEPLGEAYFLVFALVTLAFLFVLPEGLVPRLIREGRRLQGCFGDRSAVPDGGRTAASRRGSQPADRDATPLGQTIRKYLAKVRDHAGRNNERGGDGG